MSAPLLGWKGPPGLLGVSSHGNTHKAHSASSLADRPRRVCSPKDSRWARGISWGLNLSKPLHCLMVRSSNAEKTLRRVPGMVHPRSWNVKIPWLNTSAAVGQVKMPKPAHLRVRQGLQTEQQLGGVWWSGSLWRGTVMINPLKLPNAYSDRGYASLAKQRAALIATLSLIHI